MVGAVYSTNPFVFPRNTPDTANGVMRTPFCDSASHRWTLVLVATRSHFGSDVINVIHYRNAATLPLVPKAKKIKDTHTECPYFLAQEEGFEPPWLLA